MRSRLIPLFVIVLALAGVADSAYALNQHYAPAETSRCDVTAAISCTAINQSEYSKLSGVPVAAIGVAGYALIGALAGVGMMPSRQKRVWQLLLAMSTIALGFSLWLTWVELFILRAVCPLCVISLALIAAISALTALMVWKGRTRNQT
ncbi:MAG: vitamin K epoxide reductase family protein [Thermoleophilia bacterium]|nr:vitamin K epoxide reductase family protein [Thermoleophilia bacterium]